MASTDASVTTTLRIPGAWSQPGDLLERIPADFRMTADTLVLPDGAEFELAAIAPDDQFAEIFESSCRRPATDEELVTVGRYTVNIALSGPPRTFGPVDLLK